MRALTASGAAIDGSIEADDRRTAQRLLREREPHAWHTS